MPRGRGDRRRCCSGARCRHGEGRRTGCLRRRDDPSHGGRRDGDHGSAPRRRPHHGLSRDDSVSACCAKGGPRYESADASVRRGCQLAPTRIRGSRIGRGPRCRESGRRVDAEGEAGNERRRCDDSSHPTGAARVRVRRGPGPPRNCGHAMTPMDSRPATQDGRSRSRGGRYTRVNWCVNVQPTIAPGVRLDRYRSQ